METALSSLLLPLGLGLWAEPHGFGHIMGFMLRQPKRKALGHIIHTRRIASYGRCTPLDSSQHGSLQHTLKEWAVTVRALERGDTALVVRKGGIREKVFAVKDSRFLLLPGYEHQRAELLKPEYRELLREIPDLTDDGPLRFTSFAEVRGAYEISEPESLAVIDPHHMWTPEYAESRFKWRPKKPLTVLILRTYLLQRAVELPYGDEHGGCKSWIRLEEPVFVEGARAALSDEDFDRLVAPALSVLGSLEPAPIGS